MEDNIWRPAHLTPGQMEERRLAAARLLRQGRLCQAEIARQLNLGAVAPVSRVGPPPWLSRAGADWPPEPELDERPGLRRRPGLIWLGSWTGVPWPPALRPSAGP
ncbi:hypothetical protein MicloDRAFT_00069940 [Microvirga lotononidis]|uniref:Uncharacterized protein n=1 Tax=Microvirga lotononidis TaxID=864069 RepID=I4YK49_9HYPH|nr:hypothetical protein MicloDRAFT_00069940 [Microvirga lotononidis]